MENLTREKCEDLILELDLIDFIDDEVNNKKCNIDDLTGIICKKIGYKYPSSIDMYYTLKAFKNEDTKKIDDKKWHDKFDGMNAKDLANGFINEDVTNV